jgi:hypothetical protein
VHGWGLDKRWVVERGFAQLRAFKPLHTRYEQRADIHLDLFQWACVLIGYRRLPSFSDDFLQQTEGAEGLTCRPNMRSTSTARDPANGLWERTQGKGYVDAGTSPPVWAKSLLTTFQVPSMRTSWK